MTATLPVIHVTAPDDVGRIRLNSAILDGVTWLGSQKSSAPIDCLFRIGVERQLVVTPLDEVDEPELQAFGGDNLQAARHHVSRWHVRLSAEPTKRRREFTLPRELRLLGLAPIPGDSTVVFAFGSRLEIWRGALWVQHVTEFEKLLDTRGRLEAED